MGCLSSFAFHLIKLFFPGDTDLNHAIHNFHRIGRDIHDNRQLHSLARPHIELAAMARTDNIIALQIPVSEGPVIMCADVGDRKKLVGDVEDHNRFSLHLNK